MRTSLPLREVDPEIAQAIDLEGDRQARTLELIASREFRQRGGARGAGFGDDQQVCRGLAGQSLLRRLRVRGRGGKPGHRARQETLRRGARERAAALRQPGQPGRLHDRAEAGRHNAGHEPRPRRPPDARPPAQFLRKAVQDCFLRRTQGYRDHRLRRARAPGARASSPS